MSTREPLSHSNDEPKEDPGDERSESPVPLHPLDGQHWRRSLRRKIRQVPGDGPADAIVEVWRKARR